MRISTFGALSFGALLTAPLISVGGPASALPAAMGQVSPDQSLVQNIEFIRRPDGSVYWRRADPNSQGPYLFYYRGYAYPYYPGYGYRAARNELQPFDQPHRVRVRQ